MVKMFHLFKNVCLLLDCRETFSSMISNHRIIYFGKNKINTFEEPIYSAENYIELVGNKKDFETDSDFFDFLYQYDNQIFIICDSSDYILLLSKFLKFLFPGIKLDLSYLIYQTSLKSLYLNTREFSETDDISILKKSLISKKSFRSIFDLAKFSGDFKLALKDISIQYLLINSIFAKDKSKFDTIFSKTFEKLLIEKYQGFREKELLQKLDNDTIDLNSLENSSEILSISKILMNSEFLQYMGIRENLFGNLLDVYQNPEVKSFSENLLNFLISSYTEKKLSIFLEWKNYKTTDILLLSMLIHKYITKEDLSELTLRENID